jgi:hypothetical protein
LIKRNGFAGLLCLIIRLRLLKHYRGLLYHQQMGVACLVNLKKGF